MGKKPPIRVALDLETTGLHAEQDAILEVAAVKFQGTTILDRFDTLITPGRAIPYRVQRLTGILPQQLVGAPSFEAIASQLQLFISDYPIVGHSIPFDVGFLRRRGLQMRNNLLIDTFELATVLLPSLSSYNLGQVAQALGITVSPGRHRAMVDTLLAMETFLALYQRLQGVELGLLKDLASLDAPRTWPLLTFFRQELRERQEQNGLLGKPMRGSLGDQFAAQLGMDPRVLSFAVSSTNKAEPFPGETTALPSVIPALESLEQIQTLSEVTSEQTEQPPPRDYHAAHTAVREALAHGTPLLMEVTVGGNDFTPALLPALEWLNEASSDPALPPKRLVIACASQQHARRLTETILPRLQALLKSHQPVAYLAEEGGYLCVHRWFGAALRRTSGELTAEQARGLAKLGLWAHQSRTGERSELTILPQEITAWQRISSGVERLPLANEGSGTAFHRCIYRQKGYCFVSRAEERVQAATIAITTHVGLFDDLARPHSLLSKIDRRLILDADQLEDEYIRWRSAELDQSKLLGMLNTLGLELPDGRYQGLLALAAPALRENGPGGFSATPTVGKAELDHRLLSWFQMLRQTRITVEALFKAFGRLLEEFVQQGMGNSGRDKGRSEGQVRSHTGRNVERADQPLRLTGQIRNLGTWMDVERTWQQTAQKLQSVIDSIHEAEKVLLTTRRSRHRLDAGGGEEDILASEFTALARQLQEQKKLGQQALSLGESEIVYWLRTPLSPPSQVQQMAHQRQAEPSTSAQAGAENIPILYAQQVQTPAVIRNLFLQPGASTIFVGAALSVDHSFSFCRSRFGMENDTCPALSVVTDHHEQTLLYLPNDVPEPNMPQYQRHLDDAILQLATALDGQLVVLHTSHAGLRSSYGAVKPILEARGILVLGQGVDGSPRQLWNIFHEQKRIVLLGTGGFWDGVEEILTTPACILVARLPMPVLNDPPIAARAEHYSDQLHQLTVPIASLRVRKVLNRLAWSGIRRNAVVLFDRRVISKEYGSTVLHTLPRCSQRQGNVSLMSETILDWLTATGSWD